MTELNLTKRELFSIESDDDSGNLIKISKIRYRTNDDITYQLIRYDKNIMILDSYETIGLYRSVICDLTNKKVVSFSPPKSIDMYRFKKKNIPWNKIRVEEFVEGIMINLFWEEPTEKWQIATRSLVEGEVVLPQDDKTINELFFETTKLLNINLDTLSKKYCYSLVLQHNSLGLITLIDGPSIYLIEAYELVNNDKIGVNIVDIVDHPFKTPHQYTQFENLEDAEGFFRCSQDPFKIMGVVFKSGMVRSKIRNPNFENIRLMKSNTPKLQYIYLALRQLNKVKIYLKLNSQHRKLFNTYRDQLHNYTRCLFNNYLECYVHKKKSINEYSPQFSTNMKCLHRQYIDSIKCNKKIINFKETMNYVNTMHPLRQMDSINYHYLKIK